METREGYGPLQVCESGAGYYVGRLYNYYKSDGSISWSEPGSRDSMYFATQEQARQALDNWHEEVLDVSTPAKLATYINDSTSWSDYGQRCLNVKRCFDGHYPDFWFDTIMKPGGGVIDKLLRRFGSDN